MSDPTDQSASSDRAELIERHKTTAPGMAELLILVDQAKETQATPGKISTARETFYKNLADVTAFLDYKPGRFTADLPEAVSRVENYVHPDMTKLKELAESAKSAESADKEAVIEPLMKSLKSIVSHLDSIVSLAVKVGQSQQKLEQFKRVTPRWTAVMLVTFLETYFEDILIGMAETNPRLVQKTQTTFADTLHFDSMDELRAAMTRLWAHDALRPDGPRTWVRQLKDMGAKKPIDQGVVSEVEHMWDTRNLIVHSRCVADATYAKKYSSRGAVRGEVVSVTMDSHLQWMPAVEILINWADEFFMKYGG